MASAARREMELRAAKLLHNVQVAVRRAPLDRAAILGSHLWGTDGDAGATSWAIHAAGQMVDQVAGGSAPDQATVGVFAAGALDRRLDDLRARGLSLHQVDGVWYRERARRGGQGDLVRVELPRNLVQDRLRRNELAARRSTEILARRLGLSFPDHAEQNRAVRSGQDLNWADLDPRLEAHWAAMTAAHAARIAHDDFLDTYRHASWDRMAIRGVYGWVRRAEATACGACLGLADGEVHPVTDRRFLRHTRCRCVPEPALREGTRPPTGHELFETLTEEEQDALFLHRGGRAKASAVRDGLIDLTDLVQVDRQRAAYTDYAVSETPLKLLGLAPDDPDHGIAIGVPYPAANAAVIPPAKLRDYALNPGHQGGGAHKARVFAAVGGIGRTDWQWLSDALRAALVVTPVTAVRRASGPQTLKFTAVLLIDFPNGTTAPVTTAWKVLGDGSPQLVSAYIDPAATRE